MDISILGLDEQTWPLAQAATELGHRIVWCGDIHETQVSVATQLGLEDRAERWEALLDHETCDLVILGCGTADQQVRFEQLSQLTKNSISVLSTFPLFDSLLSYYEIDMARNESDAVLQHFNPLVEHTGIIELCKKWLVQGHPTLGEVEQVVFARPLGDRSQQNVLDHFARDVELLDRIAGKLNRLGALGSPNEQATYSGLSVQLLGRSDIPVRWEVGPLEQSKKPMVTIVAKQGRATICFDDIGGKAEITTYAQEANEISQLDSVNVFTSALQRVLEVVRSNEGPKSSWGNALRAMELTDTIEISLRRGRMIDVHEQQLTEQMAFKGTMSALGCGVLIVLVPLLLAIGWLAEQVGIPVAKYWPHLLLVLLAIFLMVQLVPKFFLEKTDSDSNS